MQFLLTTVPFTQPHMGSLAELLCWRGFFVPKANIAYRGYLYTEICRVRVEYKTFGK